MSEESILAALEQEWIRRAVLDVFPSEPLPPESKLWQHPRVHITPHASGVTNPDLMAQLFVENLRRWCKDETLGSAAAQAASRGDGDADDAGAGAGAGAGGGAGAGASPDLQATRGTAPLVTSESADDALGERRKRPTLLYEVSWERGY